jgi:hypothetical protein
MKVTEELLCSQIFTVKEEKFFALYLDTGAAANLSGDIYLLRFEKMILMAAGIQIQRRPGNGSFSGISGQPLRCKEVWITPIFPGHQAGQLEYESHIIENSDLPPLLSSEAMQKQGCILDLKLCRILIPVQEGVYQVWPIKFNGYHFMWPIMNLNDETEPVYCQFGEVRLNEQKIPPQMVNHTRKSLEDRQEETVAIPQKDPDETWAEENSEFHAKASSSKAKPEPDEKEEDSEDETESLIAKSIMYGEACSFVPLYKN